MEFICCQCLYTFSGPGSTHFPFIEMLSICLSEYEYFNLPFHVLSANSISSLFLLCSKNKNVSMLIEDCKALQSILQRRFILFLNLGLCRGHPLSLARKDYSLTMQACSEDNNRYQIMLYGYHRIIALSDF